MADLYRDFYRWIGRPELLRLEQHQQRQHLEYADVFALIYLRLRLEGISPYDHVKHLLVDEMQDYTPVQYAVLSRLFTVPQNHSGRCEPDGEPLQRLLGRGD